MPTQKDSSLEIDKSPRLGEVAAKKVHTSLAGPTVRQHLETAALQWELRFVENQLAVAQARNRLSKSSGLIGADNTCVDDGVHLNYSHGCLDDWWGLRLNEASTSIQRLQRGRNLGARAGSPSGGRHRPQVGFQEHAHPSSVPPDPRRQPKVVASPVAKAVFSSSGGRMAPRASARKIPLGGQASARSRERLQQQPPRARTHSTTSSVSSRNSSKRRGGARSQSKASSVSSRASSRRRANGGPGSKQGSRRTRSAVARSRPQYDHLGSDMRRKRHVQGICRCSPEELDVIVQRIQNRRAPRTMKQRPWKV